MVDRGPLADRHRLYTIAALADLFLVSLERKHKNKPAMVPRAPQSAPQSAPQPPQFMRDGYPSPPAAFRAPGRISVLLLL